MGTVVVFAGEYDLSCKKQLRAEFRRLEAAPRVALDFSEVTFIDSTCITEVMRLSKLRYANGVERLTIIVKAGAPVQRLFSIVGVVFVCDLVESLDEALEKSGAPFEVRYAFSGVRASEDAPLPFESAH